LQRNRSNLWQAAYILLYILYFVLYCICDCGIVKKYRERFAYSVLDTVRQRSPQRVYCVASSEYEDGEHIRCRHERGSAPDRPVTAAVVCCCHGDRDRPRWPHTCLDDVQLSRSLSGINVKKLSFYNNCVKATVK